MGQTGLQAGFGRRDITPEYAVPLGGYGNSHMRMSQGWYTRIYATCIAFTDTQGETVLLFTVDQIRSEEHWTRAVRARITAVTGIPGPRIMVCATHTHSGPDIGEALDGHPYFELYVQALTDAAVDALADRAPTKAFMGRTQVEGMNFVRHYRMSDGSVVGAHFGDPTGKEFLGHTVPVDQQMQLLRLVREEKPDILMLNWQSHPLLGSVPENEQGALLRPFVGADYVGPLRGYVENNAGCLVAFYQGASGNINPMSQIPWEQSTRNLFDYGRQVGEYVLAALDSLIPVQAGCVQTRQINYVGQWDHSEDAMLPQAKLIDELWRRTNDTHLCKREGAKYGIHSAYHAMFIVNRANSYGTCEMELNAISLGDVAFVTAPFEMFCNNAQTVKQKSPYAMTFVLGLSNAACGYLASEAAFDHGCYEVDNRKFGRGTAEKAVSHFLEMLQDMKTE